MYAINQANPCRWAAEGKPYFELIYTWWTVYNVFDILQKQQTHKFDGVNVSGAAVDCNPSADITQSHTHAFKIFYIQ